MPWPTETFLIALEPSLSKKNVVLGHEFTGSVVACGPEAEDLFVGDRVVSLHWAQDLAWPAPNLQNPTSTFLGITCDGGYAEHVTCHESAFVKLPKEVEHWSAAEASSVISTYGTFWHGAVTRGGLSKGDSLLITGAAGGCGTAAVQIANALGVKTIGVTRSSTKKDYLLGKGCHEVIVTEESGEKFSKTLSSNVDFVYEACGAPTFTESIRSLRPEGKLILAGNVTNTSADLPLGLCILNSLSIIGTDSIAAAAVPDVFRFMQKHDLRPHIAQALPLSEASATRLQNLVEKSSVCGRVVLTLPFQS